MDGTIRFTTSDRNVHLSGEVAAWARGRGQGRSAARIRADFARLRIVIDKLEYGDGSPDNETLFDLSDVCGGLCIAIVTLHDGDWCLSYYVAGSGGIRVLTAFAAEASTLQKEWERACALMHTCMAKRDRVNEL